MATGVASPSAHGQLMTRTETALARAKAKSLPVISQPVSVIRETMITPGTNTADTRSAILEIGALVAAASETSLTIAANEVSSHCGGSDLIALLPVGGDALSRKRRLVDDGGAAYNHAVRGDILPGLHDENVAGLQLRNRDLSLLPVLLHNRGLGREFHEAFERIGRAALGVGLQGLPEGDEAGDHGGGLEPDVVHEETLNSGAVSLPHLGGHGKERRQAVKERGGGQWRRE